MLISAAAAASADASARGMSMFLLRSYTGAGVTTVNHSWVVFIIIVSEQFLNGTSAHYRLFSAKKG